jgi:hypothetical protein
MRSSVPDALGFMALLRTRTTCGYGVPRKRRDRLVFRPTGGCARDGIVRARSMNAHHAATADRPTSAMRHRLNRMLFSAEFVASLFQEIKADRAGRSGSRSHS